MTERNQPRDPGKSQPDRTNAKGVKRGKPTNRDRWPASGKMRAWLEHCDRVREVNGTPSLAELSGKMSLTARTRVNDLLRGLSLPANENQARDLLVALGATDREAERGVRLYKEAHAEQDQAKRDAGQPDWWLRSGYADQVRDIAPPKLLARQGELDELRAWCTGGDEAYVRWEAGPWAGKSALMAWLVLHPPPGTWVISFFVTAPRNTQADSVAYTDGLLDQLAAITHAQVPASASPGQRDLLRRQMLEQAAELAAKAGRRLVLVVDGLDEDCGSLPGSGLASIAACLPKRTPPALRVIIAARPDPSVPADVDRDHPLHRCRVRPLSASPHAAHVMHLAQRELDTVLATDKDRHGGLGREVLGLVTASGGGLGHRDLQQLTGQDASSIERLLNGTFGRTVAARADPHTETRVFQFAHETLRKQVADRLGPYTLDDFAGRLHSWAVGYQHSGWPQDTPEYLLRGYPRMLADTDDLGRLVTLATDSARHHRMLDGTGGDAAALAEIAAAHALICKSPSPDLLAALRLARHRDQLTDRNTVIPARLPAVWATLGQRARAAALARSFPGPYSQARALAEVASVAAAAGDCDRARRLLGDAEQTARSLTSRSLPGRFLTGRSRTSEHKQAEALAAVASVAAAVGDYDRAEQAAWSLPGKQKQAEVLAAVASVVAAAGDCDRGRRLAGDAEQAARSLTSKRECEQVEVLAAVASAAAAVGDYDRARRLAVDAEQLARSLSSEYEQARALIAVASAAAAAGDHDRAEQIAQSLPSPDEQAQALALAAVASSAAPVRARSWTAGALAAGRWTIPLKALARTDPRVLSAFADELTTTATQSGLLDNGLLSGTSPVAWRRRHGKAGSGRARR